MEDKTDKIINLFNEVKLANLLWLSCIEKPRSIQEINEFWEIKSNKIYKSYAKEKLAELKLITIESVTKGNLTEHKISSKIDWIAEFNFNKTELVITESLLGVVKSLFLTLSKEQKLDLLNSDLLRKYFLSCEHLKKYSKILSKKTLADSMKEVLRNKDVKIEEDDITYKNDSEANTIIDIKWDLFIYQAFNEFILMKTLFNKSKLVNNLLRNRKILQNPLNITSKVGSLHLDFYLDTYNDLKSLNPIFPKSTPILKRVI